MSRRLWIPLAIGLVCASGLVGQAEEPSRRWLYLQTNLQVEDNLIKAELLARRAKDAGYNAVVLADYKLNILDRVPRHYFRHAERFNETCQELGLEIIPAVCPMGYSDGLLAHNPNLVEGIPVHEAEFVVRDGFALLASKQKNLLPGGDFEDFKDNTATGWGFQDFPGDASRADGEVKHSGRTSLRFENLSGRNGRVSRRISVKPWQLLHASVWLKTDRFAGANNLRMFAIGSDGRVLSHSNLGANSTQDWTQHHVMLNTLENDQITFYVGSWGGTSGRFWMDEVRFEEAAFVNLVRREACPLVVRTPDGRELKEGVDFDSLADHQLGNVLYPGSFNVYHEPPELRLLPASGLKNGDRLTISYYHTVTIYNNQVTCCLGDPEVFQVLERQIRRVEELFQPKTYFLSHDEIRVANWCPACHREGQSAGELLAENMRRCVGVIRGINATAQLCVWSDMFDPYHNARNDFYLVQGDLAGSWEGLPQDMIVVNWNHGQAAKSLPFFGDRGHDQVLAGYYDSNPVAIRNWLETGTRTRGVNGAMYTTWTDNFDHIEAFAKAAWGR